MTKKKKSGNRPSKVVAKDGLVEVREYEPSPSIQTGKKIRAAWDPHEVSKVSFYIIKKELGDFYVKMSQEGIYVADFLTECVDAFISGDEFMTDTIMKRAKRRFKYHGCDDAERRKSALEKERREIFNIKEQDLPEL